MSLLCSGSVLFLPGAYLPGDDGEMGRVHAGSHEQHHILVARLSVVHHLLLEELQMVLVVAVDLQQPDGHLPVPAAFVHLAPAAFADQLPQLQLLEGDVPLLEVDTGLAGLARDRPLPVAPGAGEVVKLVCFVLPLRLPFRLLRLALLQLLRLILQGEEEEEGPD